MKLNEQNGPTTISHCWAVTLFACFAIMGSESVAESELLIAPRAQTYHGVRFSPDGRFVVASCGVPRKQGSGLAIWETATGELLQWIDNTARDIPGGVASWDFCPPNHLVAVSPNSSKLYFIQHHLIDRKDTWKLMARLPRKVHPQNRLIGMDAIACSTDGKHLACTSAAMYRPPFGAATGAIEIWDIAQQRIRSTIESPDRFSWALHFIGEDLAFMCSRTIVRANIDGDIVATRKAESFVTHDPSFSTMDVSPDGQQIAVAGKGYIAIVDAKTFETIHTFPIPNGETSQVIHYTPDGRRLIEGETFQHIRVWDTESGKILDQREFKRIADLDISPDGETIALTSKIDTKGVFLWNLKDLINAPF